MFLPITTTLAALAAAPISTDISASIIGHSGTTCKTDGALLCSGGGSQYALCNWGHAVFQPVAAGTICVCSQGDDEQCTIASADGSSPSAPPSPPSTQPSPPPPPPSASPSMHTITSHAPAPSQAPVHSSAPLAAPSGNASAPVRYNMFIGNGSASQGWPTMSDWKEFDELWAANEAHISGSCSYYGQANNSPQEMEDLRKGILQVAKEYGMDSRFALAAVIQESSGCVRVPTTTYSVPNPGLLQSHNGTHNCVDKSPCPASEIHGMLHDGLHGTPSGAGYGELMKTVGTCGAQQYYRSARAYNSGSVPADGNLAGGCATHCYCSDIANRLVGWSTGNSTCTLDK